MNAEATMVALTELPNSGFVLGLVFLEKAPDLKVKGSKDEISSELASMAKDLAAVSPLGKKSNPVYSHVKLAGVQGKSVVFEGTTPNGQHHQVIAKLVYWKGNIIQATAIAPVEAIAERENWSESFFEAITLLPARGKN